MRCLLRSADLSKEWIESPRTGKPSDQHAWYWPCLLSPSHSIFLAPFRTRITYSHRTKGPQLEISVSVVQQSGNFARVSQSCASCFSKCKEAFHLGKLECSTECRKLPNIFNSSNPFKSSMHLITIDNPNHFSGSLHGRHDGFQLCLMQRLRNEGSWQRKEGSTKRMVYSQNYWHMWFFWKSSPVTGFKLQQLYIPILYSSDNRISGFTSITYNILQLPSCEEVLQRRSPGRRLRAWRGQNLP